MAIYGPELARLAELTALVREKRATAAQRDEFVALMYRSERLTQWQYDQYHRGKDMDLIIGSALVVAGLVLVAYLVTKLGK